MTTLAEVESSNVRLYWTNGREEKMVVVDEENRVVGKTELVIEIGSQGAVMYHPHALRPKDHLAILPIGQEAHSWGMPYGDMRVKINDMEIRTVIRTVTIPEQRYLTIVEKYQGQVEQTSQEDCSGEGLERMLLEELFLKKPQVPKAL